jgi:plastocyanin
MLSCTTRRVGLLLAALLLCPAAATAGTVTLKVAVEHPKTHREDSHRSANVVVWLRPLDSPAPELPTARRYEMAQKDKQFHPHVLAIPVGANVFFPNRDPIFHNVFSLYKGERFDLGLYEAGSSRAVKFERPGVSFVFCNIHPEMSAYIVALETPYFAVSDEHGDVRIPDVPAGRYRMGVWYERAEPKALAALARDVVVTDGDTSLAALSVPESEKFVPDHTDKFGKPYTSDKIPY